MKKIKIMCAIMLVAMFFVVSAGEAKESSEDICGQKVKKGGKVFVDYKNRDLYKEFSNPGKALESIKIQYKKEIQLIKKKYHLNELADNNWKQYYDRLNGVEMDKSVKIELIKFFETYSNTEINKRIKSISNRNELSEKEKRVCMKLPNDHNMYSEDTTYSEIGRKLSHINDAIRYAEKFATFRNTAHYESFSKDCTNFVSQIMEVGGMKQTFWWSHRKVHAYGGIYHLSSRAWTVADNFVRLMGVSSKYKSHYQFSKYLYRGNVIAVDFNSDGRYDHVAFVTKTENFAAKYGKKRYYDYKVAQHTSDYHAWTSWERNHWEFLEDKNATYAKIGYGGTY